MDPGPSEVCQPPDIRRRPATTLRSPVSSRKQSQQQRHLCFLCQGANYHHPGGLKQHPLIRSPSCGSGFQLSVTEFPAQASRGSGQVVRQAEGSSGDPAEALLPCLFLLLEEFISLWLCNRGPCFLAGCQLGPSLGPEGYCLSCHSPPAPSASQQRHFQPLFDFLFFD